MGESVNGGNGGVVGLAKEILRTQGLFGLAFLLLLAALFGWIPSPLMKALSDHVDEARDTKREIQIILRALCYRLPEAKIACEEIITDERLRGDR